MRDITITAKVGTPTVKQVYACEGTTGLVRIGRIEKVHGGWQAHGLVYGDRKGAALDVARRHFAIEPGLNNPNVTLTYRSR